MSNDRSPILHRQKFFASKPRIYGSLNIGTEHGRMLELFGSGE